MSRPRATVACARCGEEGERGDQPGEGKIVHGGGEVALGQFRNDLLCDDCADELFESFTPPKRFELLPGNEEPMQVLSLRLRKEDVEELDRRAEKDHGGNRSAAVRAWLDAPENSI